MPLFEMPALHSLIPCLSLEWEWQPVERHALRSPSLHIAGRELQPPPVTMGSAVCCMQGLDGRPPGYQLCKDTHTCIVVGARTCTLLHLVSKINTQSIFRETLPAGQRRGCCTKSALRHTYAG